MLSWDLGRRSETTTELVPGLGKEDAGCSIPVPSLHPLTLRDALGVASASVTLSPNSQCWRLLAASGGWLCLWQRMHIAGLGCG